jgi:hypothetical protein
MRTEIDNTATCDGKNGCTATVEVECGCPRCDGEPLTTERFHACSQHRGAADTAHRQLRGYSAEWWGGRLVPPSMLTGAWGTDGLWSCKCPIKHAKEHVACRHCHQVRPVPGAVVERVRRGFYRHHGSDDPYFVTSVSIRDEHGHGNADAPRDVNYESTRSVESGFTNSRTEAEFTALVKWPDSVMRPRFVRVKP